MCVFDASEPLTHEDRALFEECASKPHLVVGNKVDLLSRQYLTPGPSPDRRGEALKGTATLSYQERVPPRSVAGGEILYISAKTGEGLEELVTAVKKLSLSETGGEEARWMLNVRHQAALERAREALAQAADAARKDAYEECVALELHTTLGALGEIIGETATEDLLDQIFSKFCIGK